jgi:hypothetical protein
MSWSAYVTTAEIVTPDETPKFAEADEIPALEAEEVAAEAPAEVAAEEVSEVDLRCPIYRGCGGKSREKCYGIGESRD